MATIKTSMGEFKFLECYKGRNIVQDEVKEGETPTIMVHDPQRGTVFIVCMDDSKRSGKRTFSDEHNTVEAARDYINWVTSPK